jgi:transcriptional regulator with XRE-family HTH domain
MSNVGKNLESARLARGLTMEQIAEVLGMSRQTYALIEACKKEITVSQAEKLAAMLRVELGDLLGALDGISTLSNTLEAVKKYKQIIINTLKAGADDDGKITKTKLAKLVYLADFTWYYNNLTPMSGMTYRKLPQGPVADVYFRALDELEEEGIINPPEYKGKATLFSLVEKGEVPASELTKDEKKIIDKICKAWKGYNTEAIVDFTHNQLPWQICRDGEAIPYGLITQEEPDHIWNPQTTL